MCEKKKVKVYDKKQKKSIKAIQRPTHIEYRFGKLYFNPGLTEEDLNSSEKICDTKNFAIIRAKLVGQNLENVGLETSRFYKTCRQLLVLSNKVINKNFNHKSYDI